MKRKRVGGAEQEAFSRRHWRRVMRAYKPGERKDLKRKANRRERREARLTSASD